MLSTTCQLTTPIDQVPILPRTGTSASIGQSGGDGLLQSRVMIIDDEPINIFVAEKYLRLAGYTNIVTTTDPREALATLAEHQADLVLLDIMMPQFSGLEFLAALRADPGCAHLPVIVLTAANDRSIKRQALELGANDFLSKPVDPSELLPRVRNVLTVKKHQDYLQRYSCELEEAVLRRTAQLARSRQEVIHCLARAAEFRDDDTGRHVYRVGRYARLIAEELGWTGEQLDILEQAAQLHDIGKIGIPDAILLKPAKLTAEEFEIMQKHSDFGRFITQTIPDNEANVLREHTELGSRLLQDVDSPFLVMAATIALSHHEKWNGAGYPLKLVGENIPIEGRITAVADVFDALSSKRPYKPAFPVEKCFAILAEGRGEHFDPRVLDAFFARRNEVIQTLIQYADQE
jgi:putative two-component system response regulator